MSVFDSVQDNWDKYIKEKWTGEEADRKSQENFQSEQDRQREFAQMGIRWRVDDAKAAGLHPLSVLGVQPTQASPINIPGSSGGDPAFSGGVVNALLRGSGARDRELHLANLAVMRSQVKENDARAAYYDSEAARVRQSNGATTPIPSADNVKVEPDKQVSVRSDDPSITAGTHGGLREYTVSSSGLKMALPYSEEGPGEALENISWWQWPAIIQMNRSRYGDNWGRRFIQEFMFGKEYRPKFRSNDSRSNPRYRDEEGGDFDWYNNFGG